MGIETSMYIYIHIFKIYICIFGYTFTNIEDTYVYIHMKNQAMRVHFHTHWSVIKTSAHAVSLKLMYLSTVLIKKHEV